MAGGGRCLRAAHGLLLQLQHSHSVCCPYQASLLQQLHSSYPCSTFGLSNRFSTLIGCQTGWQQHCSSSAVWQLQDQQQQQQQQQQQLLHSHQLFGSPALIGASIVSGKRCYARAAAGFQSPRNKRMSSRPRQQQQQQMHRGGPSTSQLTLGRVAKQCVPTELLREPAVPKDPWKDRDPRLVNPIQVDGSREDGTEEVMLLRQQLENSALPNAFKRSHLISPHWDDVLLEMKRTVKVTKGGKVETLHALVVVGNQDGVIGVGEHSGKNVQKVTLDAHMKAYKNLKVIPRYRGHTIFHPIDIRHRKIRLQAWPRQLGFGITASPLMTELCDLVGIDNITIKVSGRRRNIKKVLELFVEALTTQSVPHDGVEGSGVYMREVYPWKKLPCGLRRGVDVP